MTKSYTKKLDYTVPEVLKEHVISVIVGESEPGVHEFLPVHANGFPLIILVYGDIPTLHFKAGKTIPDSRLVVAGQIKNESVQMEIEGTFGQIGVVLNPTSTYYLFHKSGKYFCNRWMNFTQASSLPFEDYVGRLLEEKEIEGRIGQLFQMLKTLHSRKLSPIPWLDESIKNILNSNGMVSQKELANGANVCIRQFRRMFKKVIGISPKYYCKVIQVNTTIELMKSSNVGKLNHLALDCGYFDQAHFTKDFKNFIGRSPRDFLNGDHGFIKTYLGR